MHRVRKLGLPRILEAACAVASLLLKSQDKDKQFEDLKYKTLMMSLPAYGIASPLLGTKALTGDGRHKAGHTL